MISCLMELLIPNIDITTNLALHHPNFSAGKKNKSKLQLFRENHNKVFNKLINHILKQLSNYN